MNMKDENKKTGKNRILRVLVTGGTGFVGRAVAEKLSKSCKVRVFAREKAIIKNAEVFAGNLLDKNDARKSLENIDIVVHLAAMILGDEKEIYSFNVESTEILVNAALNSSVKKLIFLSSENVMWKAQSAYGESKKKCEEIVKSFNNHLILRSSAIYGKGSNVILGKVINCVKKSKVIFMPGNGKSLMQPIYVEDAANYIINGIKYGAKGTYVIAGSSKITFNDFINTASKILKVKRIIVHIPLWVISPILSITGKIFKNPPIKLSQIKNLNTSRTYDISKAIKELKYTPVGIEEGLKKTLT